MKRIESLDEFFEVLKKGRGKFELSDVAGQIRHRDTWADPLNWVYLESGYELTQEEVENGRVVNMFSHFNAIKMGLPEADVHLVGRAVANLRMDIVPETREFRQVLLDVLGLKETRPREYFYPGQRVGNGFEPTLVLREIG